MWLLGILYFHDYKIKGQKKVSKSEAVFVQLSTAEMLDAERPLKRERISQVSHSCQEFRVQEVMK